MRGPALPHTPENDHPGVIQAPIARKPDFATGQSGGFLGHLFLKSLFLGLFGIPAILNRIKPASMELFGLRIGRGDGVDYAGEVLAGFREQFWSPAFLSICSGDHPPDTWSHEGA